MSVGGFSVAKWVRRRRAGDSHRLVQTSKGTPVMGDSHYPADPREPVVIDCDDCAVRGPGCRDCVVSVLLGVPETLLADERAALEVLAEAGLAPRLRLVPIHHNPKPGVA